MFTKYKRRRQLSKVKPGDGSALPRYRLWQLFSRSLFALELAAPSGRHLFAVDVRHGRDSSSSKRPAALYRDGRQVHVANLPVTFPVPGGVIEVATSLYGVKRMHYVGDDGREQVLSPHPRSAEGLRARFDRRFPRTSAVIGAVGLVVLLVGLAVTLSVAVEQITRIEVVAAHLGTFTSPVQLPGWAQFALPAAGALAAVDRALRLKSTWMAD
ncbi:hypothetical protein [Pseudonocardia humida]|uniref:Uncharacterized protein n=1 Tax=Pseudonocardia humida TaxID=2800819 RepID=A0ABT1AC06_9PSEU|nr:hypothetical protein [Pseudonocardia humida]MCO1660580.1 hypothetical protein [Pseudonocardia humida]